MYESAFCRICLGTSGGNAFHPICQAGWVQRGSHYPRDRRDLAVLIPIWPIERAREEQAAFMRVLVDFMPVDFPPELWALILSFASPDSKSCARYRADKDFGPLNVLGKALPRDAENGVHFLRSLEVCFDPRYLYPRQEESGQDRAANASASRPDESARFEILSYDDYNCVRTQFSDDVVTADTVRSGLWYHVIPTATLAGKVDVITKVAIEQSGTVFFNISCRQDPVLDCVWNTPCLPPDSWYRKPRSVDAGRDPTRDPPVRMRILGDMSHAEGVTFANRQNEGVCAIFVHDGDKRAEQAFYDQLKNNEVCQYVSLNPNDSVVALGVLGSPMPDSALSMNNDKYFSPRIALSISGSTPRKLMLGPYFARPLELWLYRSSRYITRIATNESWWGDSTANLHIAWWEEGREHDLEDLSNDSWVPAFEPSDQLRIPFRTGKPTWSTVTIHHSDTFVPCLQNRGEHILCLGLRIRKESNEEILGQWRHDGQTGSVERSCAHFSLERVIIEGQPQVRLLKIGADYHGGDGLVVPMRGDLQWLTDGVGNDVWAPLNDWDNLR